MPRHTPHLRERCHGPATHSAQSVLRAPAGLHGYENCDLWRTGPALALSPLASPNESRAYACDMVHARNSSAFPSIGTADPVLKIA